MHLNLYRKKFFENQIEDYRKQVEELLKQSISPERKKYLQKEFEKLRDEFMDFLEIQMSKAKEVAEGINNLKTFKPSGQHHKPIRNNNNNKRR